MGEAIVSITDVSKPPPLASPSPEPSSPAADLGARVRDKARALGFDAVGFARADLPLDQEMERYAAFLGAGMHGEMRYLAEHAEVRRRLDTQEILEGARSVVCLARRYPQDLEDGASSGLVPHVAAYARGRDYHNFLRKKLRRLAAYIRTLPAPEGAKVEARPLCDDVPVLERAWAARAGLGFVGKNGMLIVPGQGSFVLLGEVVTTLVLPASDPLEGRCGSCRLCLDACPTGAFPRPFVLDAERCIAYLTIELRGKVPDSLRADVGEHLFGCDECQSVCPFNASSRPGGSPRGARGALPFEPGEALRAGSLGGLLTEEGSAAVLLPGSPLLRAGRDGLAANAALVLGNRRETTALGPLERSAEHHPSALVRDAARWAVLKMKA